jgi:hypothetical protein
MEEVIPTCEFIYLYKFRVIYDNEDDSSKEYEWILITDTIEKLIESLAERESVESMKDERMYLEIEEFLIIKTDKTHWSLHDIHEHDILPRTGLSLSGTIYYDVNFINGENDYPIPVKGVRDIMAKFVDDVEKLHPGDENESSVLSVTRGDDVLAKAIYGSKLVRERVLQEKEKQENHENKEFAAGIEAIAKLKEKTG